jgi:hypothetical protein
VSDSSVGDHVITGGDFQRYGGGGFPAIREGGGDFQAQPTPVSQGLSGEGWRVGTAWGLSAGGAADRVGPGRYSRRWWGGAAV